jgi:hypothetical protein
MTQTPEPDTSEPVRNEVIDQAVVLRQANPEHESTVLPEERSQFSQRLASFGLGESPDPLLRPAKHSPSPRRPRRR